MNDTTKRDDFTKSFIQSTLDANPHLYKVLQAIEPIKPRISALHAEAQSAQEYGDIQRCYRIYDVIAYTIKVEALNAGWDLPDIAVSFLQSVIFVDLGLRW